jgi:single-strand DNA-binding protein
MPSFNRVLLLGNLTRDPVLKQLPTQSQVAEFGLAVNRKFRTAQGEDREDTVFVDCAAFGKPADTIAHYCHKGRPLLVEGRLRYDSWEDKQGARHSKLSVVVESFQFHRPPRGCHSRRRPAAAQIRATARRQAQARASFAEAG